MNLNIRTKDKLALIPYDGLYIDDTDMVDKGYVTVYSKDSEFELGIYKTKERALEILDEIQNILKHISLQINNNNQFVGTTTYVYEMPKD